MPKQKRGNLIFAHGQLSSTFDNINYQYLLISENSLTHLMAVHAIRGLDLIQVFLEAHHTRIWLVSPCFMFLDHVRTPVT